MAILDMNPNTRTRKIYLKESKEDLGDNWSVFYINSKSLQCRWYCVYPHMHNSSVMHYTYQIYHVGQEQFILQMQGA